MVSIYETTKQPVSETKTIDTSTGQSTSEGYVDSSGTVVKTAEDIKKDISEGKDPTSDLIVTSSSKKRRSSSKKSTQTTEVDPSVPLQLRTVQGVSEEIKIIERVNESKGDVAKFERMLTEYEKAPEITRTRLYLETMEKVLPGLEKTIVEQEGAEGGILLHFKLDEPASGGNLKWKDYLEKL